MWGHWWEATETPPNPHANDVFIHRTVMWRVLITPSPETRSLGNRRCFFPSPPSAFSHIFSSFILSCMFLIWVPIVQVTVRRQPLSHFFIQNKQASALSNDSSDLQESFSTVVASVWQIKLGSVKSARRKAWLTIHSNWKSQTNSCYHRENIFRCHTATRCFVSTGKNKSNYVKLKSCFI